MEHDKNVFIDDTIDLDEIRELLGDQPEIEMNDEFAEINTEEAILQQAVAESTEPIKAKGPSFPDGIELLTEPITMQSLAGYVTDNTGDMDPLYEYFTITSAILHPEGLALVGTHAFDFPEEQATVIMKDGSEIILTGLNGAPYCSVSMSQLKAESSIDLSKVDHILLPDGTELSMP